MYKPAVVEERPVRFSRQSIDPRLAYIDDSDIRFQIQLIVFPDKCIRTFPFDLRAGAYFVIVGNIYLRTSGGMNIMAVCSDL